MSSFPQRTSYTGWLKPHVPVARLLIMAAAGSVFLAACAKIQVPMWPVPMTMQSFGVMTLALALGARVAVGSVGIYLAQGAFGLPLFAGGSGIAYMFGPTGGYLLGFLAMGWLVGVLSDKGWNRTVFKSFASVIMGGVILYLLGGLWLAVLIGPEAAFIQGMLPFIVGDILKALLAAITVFGFQRVIAPRS